MKTKRYWLASVAAFIVVAGLDMFINNVMLAPMYHATASVWRPQPEMMQRLWLFFVNYAVLALVFTYIYTRGIEKKKPVFGQGVRFGLLMGVLIGCGSLVWYVVLPIPAALAFWWFAVALFESVVAGALVAVIYKG